MCVCVGGLFLSASGTAWWYLVLLSPLNIYTVSGNLKNHNLKLQKSKSYEIGAKLFSTAYSLKYLKLCLHFKFGI